MATRALYVDSSALVKLVLAEAESEALRAALEGVARVASSVVARVELPLAARRAGGDPAVRQAGRVLDGIVTVALRPAVVRRAAALDDLRALDAIHLASALLLGDALDAFLAYDRRLLEAARRQGLAALAPV